MKPIVAIVGRPNVGKSSFFNTATGTKKAIVENVPGVTRDRNYADVSHRGCDFILVDTGGFFVHTDEPILREIKRQVEVALDEAEAVIAIFDGKEGLNPLDAEIAGYLRKMNKPVFFVVNKIDHGSHENRIADFFQTGADKLYPVSAEHSLGITDLLDDVVESLPRAVAEHTEEDKKYDVKVAVLGKPNVGKSSLINKLFGAERAIVSDVPGTTRDPIDTELSYGGKRYLFTDTAGIRRKARISLRLEKFTVMEALRALERVDVALLVIDAYEGISDQEQKIAQLIKERGRGCVVVMNKWDRVEKNEKSEPYFSERIRKALPFIDYAPVVFASALTGRRITGIFTHIDRAARSLGRRVSTGVLNRIIAELLERNPLPIYKGKRTRIYYGTQQDVNPPFFVLFANFPDAIPDSAVKFIERKLRELYDFEGSPIKIIVRKKR